MANFLDAVSEKSPNSRLFYAASSHVFGNPEIAPQTEQTPFLPVNIYGITKVTGIQLCRLYRRQRGLYCCAGILYNHESPRRAATYVGRKIVKTAVAIKRGEADKLVLGNLDAEIDWGAAEDYVEAMRLILSQDDPDEFVIASGELHSIGEVVDVAFGALDLDPQKYLETNPDLITKSGQSRPLVGDASKLMQATGWTPKRGFEEIILSMVDAELGT
ncbi:MAG TPA: GDP-mannose 4,6 dehydratase [Rhodospirillaceae bacterium]|nr:GDP-mannose 4,6 dehydratase [Rhodospirillaceae bacterium]